MKAFPLMRALAAAGLLAAMASMSALAQNTSTPPKRPAAASRQPAPAAPASTAPATPSGDTHVHRFFQAWGRGMDKAGAALGKVPQPDERWPGTANSRQRSASPSHEGP